MAKIQTDDLECFYEDDYFGEPWRKPPGVVLMQTGYGANAVHFQTWVPALADRFRVLRRDAVGHGGTSAGRAGRDLSLEALADDVIAFLDALGLGAVHYLGERTGAMTGIVLAARAPERIHSLTLLGCPIRCGEALQQAMHAMLPADERARYRGWSDSIRGLGGALAWHDAVNWLASPSDPARTAWQREQLHRCDEGLLERYARATIDFDISDYLGRVHAPTLVLAAPSYRTTLEDQLFIRRQLEHGELTVLEESSGRADDGSARRGAPALRAFIESVENDPR